MNPKEFDQRWNELAEEVMTGMKEWRIQHPRATFRQIEAALDERLADADTFDRLALVETHRRGVENAGQVAAVVDGAEWLQGFANWHRSDAVRILDFPHAAGYVAKIGQATWGADSPELAAWLQTQLHELKHTGPEAVLTTLQEMVAEHPQAAALELPQALAYLEKRQAQMDYPRFQTQGWPIASGATESGNKLVVEARLKGAGMHWARAHVDPMLALRNVVCNNRWDEAWPQIAAQLRQQSRDQRAARRQQRHAQAHAEPTDHDTPAPADHLGQMAATATMAMAPTSQPPSVSTAPPPPRRPAANHPWRRSPACLPSRSRWSAN